MNNEEAVLINNLATQIRAMDGQKDLEADDYIKKTMTGENVLYNLVQFSLIHYLSNQQSQEQIRQLQMQVQKLQMDLQKLQNQQQQPKQGFLDKWFGQSAPQNASPLNFNQMQQPGLTQQNFGQQSMPNNPMNASGGSSFLKQALTIGTGVAGGMMLGNALEHLFGGSSHSGANLAQQPTEIIENNYYGENPSMSQNFSNQGYDDFANNDNNFDNSTDYDSYNDSDDGGWA